MHPEQIKAALRMKGISPTAFPPRHWRPKCAWPTAACRKSSAVVRYRPAFDSALQKSQACPLTCSGRLSTSAMHCTAHAQKERTRVSQGGRHESHGVPQSHGPARQERRSMSFGIAALIFLAGLLCGCLMGIAGVVTALDGY